MTHPRLSQLGQRVALVLGNGLYAQHPLATAENDAAAMAGALRQAGFRAKLARNLNRQGMLGLAEGLAQRMPPGALALLYFSGYGLQVKGRNYLVPIDNDFRGLDENAIAARCVAVDDLVGLMTREDAGMAPLILLTVLDACRTPGPARGRKARVRGPHLAPGLAPVDVAAFGETTDLAFWFGCAPGAVAADPPGEPRGRFTGALLDAIREPIDIETLFQRAGSRVHLESQGQQQPWTTSRLRYDYYIAPADGIWLRPSIGPTDSVAGPHTDNTGSNPYRGLEAFGEKHAAVFFGREPMVDHLLSRLRELDAQVQGPRLFWLLGSSGAGKSSLVRAGLMPKLRAGALADSGDWLYLSVQPGFFPLETLAGPLAAELGAAPGSVLARLRSGADNALSTLIGEAMDRRSRPACFILLDRFERLLTELPAEERQRFLAQLLAALSDPRRRIHALATLRADFVDTLMEQHRELEESFQLHQEFLTPLSADALRKSIERPAAVAGLRLEKGLVQQLSEDCENEPNCLPLLQFALWQMSRESIENGDGLLRDSGFKENGGIRGILDRHGESIFASLPGDRERLLARHLFLQLAEPREPEDSGRQVRVLDLWRGNANDRAMQTVIRAFLDGRLLRAEKEPISGQIFLSLPHESLIRHWNRLQGWVRERRDDAQLLGRLTEAAARWERSGHDNAGLWRGRRLTAALDFRARRDEPWNDTSIDAFLAASETREQQRARSDKHWRLAIIGFALAAVAFGAVSLGLRHAADQRLNQASARQQAALAAKLIGDVENLKSTQAPDRELAALLSAESLRLQKPSPLADQALRDDLSLLPRRLFSIPRVSPAATGQFSPDNRYLLVHDRPAPAGTQAIPARLFDVSGGRQITAFSYRGSDGSADERPDPSPRFCPSGSCLYWLDGTSLMGLNLPSGRIEALGAQEVAGLGEWSPDGKYLLLYGADNALRVFEPAQGKESLRIEQPKYRVAAFSADQRGLWTLGGDGRTVRLIELRTGRERLRLNGEEPVDRLDVDPSGNWIQTIRFGPRPGQQARTLWNTGTAEALRFPFELGAAVLAADGRHAILWPRGRDGAGSAGDPDGQLWDLAEHQALSAPGLDRGENRSAFSANGQYLVAAAGQEITLWNLATGRPIRKKAFARRAWQASVAISPGSGHAAITDGNERLEIWRTRTGETTQRLPADGLVDRLVFADEGRLLVSRSGWSSLWDTRSGELLSETPAVTSATGADQPVSADLGYLFDDGTRSVNGKRVSPSSGHSVWSLAGEAQIGRFKQTAVDEGFSTDGKRYWVGNMRGGMVVDLPTGKATHFAIAGKQTMGLSLDGAVRKLLIREDDRIALRDIDNGRASFTYYFTQSPNAEVMGHDGRIVVAADPQTVRVFDGASGKETSHFSHDGNPGRLELSPSGQWLLIGNENGSRVGIWNMRTGKKDATINLEDGGHRLDLSGDERLAAITPRAGSTTQILDFPSGSLLRRIGQEAPKSKRAPEETLVKFVHGSQYLINSGAVEPFTRIWDTATGAELYRWPGQWGGISNDEETALTREPDRVHLWSLATGQEQGSLRPGIPPADGDDGRILSALLSPDGRHVGLSTASMAHVFELASGREISRIGGDPNGTGKAFRVGGFSTDGRYLAVNSGATHWIGLWRPDDLLEETCHRVSRNLTPEEWRHYLGDEPYRETCPAMGTSPAADSGN